jgi:hypothetical protein
MTTMEEYMKAREICDWIAEAQIQIAKGNITEAQEWLGRAMAKAVTELQGWEQVHGVQIGSK